MVSDVHEQAPQLRKQQDPAKNRSRRNNLRLHNIAERKMGLPVSSTLRKEQSDIKLAHQQNHTSLLEITAVPAEGLSINENSMIITFTRVVFSFFI